MEKLLQNLLLFRKNNQLISLTRIASKKIIQNLKVVKITFSYLAKTSMLMPSILSLLFSSQLGIASDLSDKENRAPSQYNSLRRDCEQHPREKDHYPSIIGSKKSKSFPSFQTRIPLDKGRQGSRKRKYEETYIESNVLVPHKKYKKRLLLGEADFSYAKALIAKHLDVHPELPKAISATEYASKEDLKETYPDTFVENMHFLQNYEVVIEFGIDARKIHKTFKGQHFPRIHFNCPHDGSSYDEGTLPQIIAAFFNSAKHLQEYGDRIHIALPHPSNSRDRKFREGKIYGIYDASSKAGYGLLKKRSFGDSRYPGYKHRITGQAKSAPVANELREYIFAKTKAVKSSPGSYLIYGKGYNVLPDINTDDDSSDYEE